MKLLAILSASLGSLLVGVSGVSEAPQSVTGDYVEVRTCDVYTGPCFANGEMNLAGKEAILAWSIRQGSWEGTPLDGLKVVAVVKADHTLGNVRRFPQQGRAVLVVDSDANPRQREALVEFARRKAGPLAAVVVGVEVSPIEMVTHVRACSGNGCSLVRARRLEIRTRCLGGKDHVCGNEECFYPPLTEIRQARPAYTLVGMFGGPGLGLTFDEAGRRSAYLGSF